jgi:N,N-dimethylformamidase beta subunit-like protein/uncharacterized protein DUF4082/Big-like domain-containing protein
MEALSRARRWAAGAAMVAAMTAAGAVTTPARADTCDVPANEIVAENCKPGTPPAQWDVSSAGSEAIQGFATDISVTQGSTVSFKIKTPATDYRLEIYRMGYYAGDGARRVGTVQPSAALPQAQPACASDASTGLVDCGNWSVSATWAVPADATSGIYFAKLVREDATAGSSHVVFIVRDDDGRSDLLLQTSDTTWQAYNAYGGGNLYSGAPAGRAYKVSYNRPFTTRASSPEDWVFNSEYPMVRWLERNGYDVSYFTGVDSDRLGAELREHRAFLSVGHDEYWSGTQRANVEAARDAGTNLAFFSGNEVFWKTRWEDGHRTLVSYKETHAGARIDPTGIWTGTWRDARSFNPDCPRPENALTGTIFTVNSGTTAIQVPAAEGRLRLWRGTSAAALAAGATETLADSTLGYEWDEDLDNGARPAGLVRLSSTVVNGVDRLQDNGSTYASGQATHHLTLYRAGGGALVFGAGTVQWSWGLDGTHDRGSSPPSATMQQATVNLLADMATQPATLEAGLAPASASEDTTPPSVAIVAPATAAQGTPSTLTGSASDAGGGRVGAVEVSVDGGTSWHPAAGREAWSYTWTPSATGEAAVRVRAADDSGNLGAAAQRTLSVVARTCPCTLFGSAVPRRASENDGQSIEVGVRFRADVDGDVTALRYYRGAGWAGGPTATLWTAAGQALAKVTFPATSAVGWQQASLSAPVAITGGTAYVVSYLAPDGSYAFDDGFFTSPFEAAPLHAPASTAGSPNGVYRYGGGFPTETFQASNYWADVAFVPTDRTPPSMTAVAPSSGAEGVDRGAQVSATFSEPLDASNVTVALRDPSGAAVAATVAYEDAARTVRLTPVAPLAFGTRYTVTVAGARDLAGNAIAGPRIWSFTTAPAPPPETTTVDPPAPIPAPLSGPAPALPAPPAAPVTDTAAPRVNVRPARARATRAGTVAVRVGCPRSEQRCRVRMRLAARSRTLGTARLDIAGAATRTVRVRLTRAALRDLRRRSSLAATVVITATDAAGNRATSRTRIRLLAPR